MTSLTLLAPLSAATFEYTDSSAGAGGVVAGTDYKYYVTASNPLGGEGERSVGLPVTPVTVPSAAAAPTLVGHGKDFIAVKWAAPASDGGASVSKYLLYVRAEYDAAY